MFEFEALDDIYLRVIASNGNQVNVTVFVMYEDGTWDDFIIDANAVGNRAVEQFRSEDPFSKAGRVVQIIADDKSGTIRRGEYYMSAFVRRGGRDDTRGMPLCAYYVSSTFLGALGFFEQSTSGKGFRHWITLSDDVTPVDLRSVLAMVRTRLKVYGFALYYFASSDVATRTMIVSLGVPGLGLPTGFSATGTTRDVWRSGTLTLTADQEGSIYSRKEDGGDGFTVLNDDGSLSSNNITTTPSPWPITVKEADIADLFVNFGLAEVADRYSLFLDVEEWLEE